MRTETILIPLLIVATAVAVATGGGGGRPIRSPWS